MDTLLTNGGFDCTRKGFPCLIYGQEELEQQIMIRLRIRKGSFPYDTKLGSRLYNLRFCTASSCESLQNCADLMVREALSPIHGLLVLDTTANFNSLGQLIIRVSAKTVDYTISKEVQIWE